MVKSSVVDLRSIIFEVESVAFVVISFAPVLLASEIFGATSFERKVCLTSLPAFW